MAITTMKRVTVMGGDYNYAGDIIEVLVKKSGEIRCVVEDDNGRLFIHNGGQVGMSSSELMDLKRQSRSDGW